jgi:hypothetical protein
MDDELYAVYHRHTMDQGSLHPTIMWLDLVFEMAGNLDLLHYFTLIIST